MRRRISVLFCLGISLLVFGTALAKPIVFSGKAQSAPAFIYIEGVGKFLVKNGKTDVIEAELERRSKLLGREIKLPSKMRIFVPATDNTAAQLIEDVGVKQIANGLVINPVYPQNKGLLRVFLGPHLVDQKGEAIVGAKMFFDGSNKVSLTRGGKINPSVEMEKGKQSVRMLIYKDGYKLKVIDIVLSKEALEDLELKVPVSESDIVLQPAPHRFLDVKVMNPLDKIYVGAQFETRYERINDQLYVFHVVVTDEKQNRAFVAAMDLTPETLKIEDVLEVRKIDKTPPEEGLVAMSEVPVEIPRIVVNWEVMELTEIKIEQAAKEEVARDLVKAELDPTYKLILLFVIFFLLFAAVILVIFVSVKKSKARVRLERQKSRLAFEQRCSLCEIPESLWSAVEQAEKFAGDTRLNRVSQDAYGPALANIHKLLEEVWHKNKYVGELSKAIRGFESFVVEQITEMESALNDSDYGMATLFQGRIEEAEERISAIEGSRDDLIEYLSNQKAVAKELFIALAKMNDKAERLISQVDSEGNLAKMGQEIQDILDGIVASFSKESVNLDPESIRRTQAERKTAQNAGVSVNDVDKMKAFIKERKER